jgi:hypothetical protein
MMDVPEYAIYVTTGKRNRTPGVTSHSRCRNILISNIIADGVGKMSGIQIMGLPEQPIEGLRIENVRLTSNGGGRSEDSAIQPRELGTGYPEPRRIGMLPAYGLFARHARDLELANITFNLLTNDFRPAVFFADIQGLELDNLKADLGSGVKPAIYAEGVQDLQVRNSPGFDRP